MKRLWLLALPVAFFAACNDGNNRQMETPDTSSVQPQSVDTSLNRPGDTMRTDTIRMDTSHRGEPNPSTADTTRPGKPKRKK